MAPDKVVQCYFLVSPFFCPLNHKESWLILFLIGNPHVSHYIPFSIVIPSPQKTLHFPSELQLSPKVKDCQNLTFKFKRNSSSTKVDKKVTLIVSHLLSALNFISFFFEKFVIDLEYLQSVTIAKQSMLIDHTWL